MWHWVISIESGSNASCWGIPDLSVWSLTSFCLVHIGHAIKCVRVRISLVGQCFDKDNILSRVWVANSIIRGFNWADLRNRDFIIVFNSDIISSIDKVWGSEGMISIYSRYDIWIKGNWSNIIGLWGNSSWWVIKFNIMGRFIECTQIIEIFTLTMIHQFGSYGNRIIMFLWVLYAQDIEFYCCWSRDIF